MTAVVVSGNLPSTGQVAARAVRLPGDQDAAGFCDLVNDLLKQHEAVLVVYPAWRPGDSSHRVRTARLALGTNRLMALPSPLSPLALSFTADLLVHLAPYAPPGALPALARRIGQSMLAGAWLRSVTRLQHVPTRFSDHVRSYLPGSTFVVLTMPEPRVTRMDVGAVRQLSRPRPPATLVLSSHKQQDDPTHNTLASALAPANVRVVSDQPWCAGFWGSKHTQEFVLFSADPKALTRICQAVHCITCRWCGMLIVAPPCPFCLVSGQVPLADDEGAVFAGTSRPSGGSALPPSTVGALS